MKKAFTLVELMIIVAILGILAAITLPEFQGQTKQAKESVAKDSIRSLRVQIEVYTAQNNGAPPGYLANNTATIPTLTNFNSQMLGKYIQTMPKNPLNGLSTMQVLSNAATFPSVATGTYGWIYQPFTKTIKLDYPGTDSAGASYFSY